MVSNDSTAQIGRHCVVWRKSRYSNPCGSCVELAYLPDGRIALRDSKHPRGPVLIYSRAEITAFIHAMNIGEL